MRITSKTLSNGLTLAVIPLQTSSLTTAVLVKTGSAHESKKQNGISHVLEHMCFKGTEKRPLPLDIAHELEGMGAQYNAFTSRDLTGYYAKTAPRFFSRAYNVISDIYLNSTLPKHELEKEKEVIIEEMRMYEDNPRWKVREAMEWELYGDQPAGRSIIGTEQTVGSFSQKDILAYREQRYAPHNTIIVVAGPTTFSEVYKQVKKDMKELSSGRKRAAYKVKKHKPTKRTIKKEVDQTHFSFGCNTAPLAHKDRIALTLLSNVLGGGMASRLFQKVREERGAAYYIGARPQFFATHGYIELLGGLNHSKSKEVYSAIAEEIKKIKSEKITEKEMKRVRDHTIGALMLSVEASDDIAFFVGEQLVTEGQIKKPKEIVKEILSHDRSDILRVARKYMKKDAFAMATIGPKKEDPKKLFKAFDSI